MMNTKQQKVPRRIGLFDFNKEAVVEATLGPQNTNKFGKKQYSAWIRGDFYYLPTHKILVEKLLAVPEGSLIRIKRLNSDGNKRNAFRYEIKTLRRGPTPHSQTTLDNF